MSAYNAAPTPLERRRWWIECVGACLVCGSPMEYPSNYISAARRRSDVDMLLFKHGLLLPMESGHMIDRYILDNAESAHAWATPTNLRDAKLRVEHRWSERQNSIMGEYVEEARKKTEPVCRDCNVAMTNVQAELTVVFYGTLRPAWFEHGLVPYKHLKAQRSKAVRSSPKIIEAIFVFLTLETDTTGRVPGVGGLSASADSPQRGGWLEDVQMSPKAMEIVQNGVKPGAPDKKIRWNSMYKKLVGVEVFDRNAPHRTGFIWDVCQGKQNQSHECSVEWDGDGEEKETMPLEQVGVRLGFPQQSAATATAGMGDEASSLGARENTGEEGGLNGAQAVAEYTSTATGGVTSAGTMMSEQKEDTDTGVVVAPARDSASRTEQERQPDSRLSAGTSQTNTPAKTDNTAKTAKTDHTATHTAQHDGPLAAGGRVHRKKLQDLRLKANSKTYTNLVNPNLSESKKLRWSKEYTGMPGVLVESRTVPGRTGCIAAVHPNSKEFTVEWDDGHPTTNIKLQDMYRTVMFPTDVRSTPSTKMAFTLADSHGLSAPADPANIAWVLKDRMVLWRDFSVLKTVSHLMQWGAHKQPRHRALAIFWSGYYLWLTCLTESEQTLLPFRVWYVFVFREYYMHVFSGNTWFSHDSLTVGQLTNVNVSMARSHTGGAGVMQWIRWVHEQLLAMQQDIMALSRYVFHGDAVRVRQLGVLRKVVTKEAISQLVDLLDTHTNGTQALFERMHAAGSAAAVHEYFRWHMFTVGNVVYTRENIVAFQSELQAQMKVARGG